MLRIAKATAILLLLPVLASGTLAYALWSAKPAVQHFANKWVSAPAADYSGYLTLASQPIASLPDEAFTKKENESDREFTQRMNLLVHATTWNCPPQDYRLSTIEQEVLHLMGPRDIFTEGVLVRSRFSCGFCHQRAFLLTQILEGNGIFAQVYGLTGHVVARVDFGDEAAFFDPDYGVGPFFGDLDAIRDGYAERPYADAALVKSIYASIEDNAAYPPHYFEQDLERQTLLFAKADNIASNKLYSGLVIGSLSLLVLAVWQALATLGLTDRQGLSRPRIA